jgi:uncharacterized cupredoxin-like copper-binding protein
MRTVLFLVGSAIVALWLGACAVSADAEPETIKIVMSDHRFQPDSVRLKAAQPVRLEIVNEGQIAHNLMAGLELERLTWGPGERLEQDFFSGVEVSHSEKMGSFSAGGPRGTELLLYPGGSAVLLFTAPADKKGEWEFGCLVPGHYESGMRGSLTVE